MLASVDRCGKLAVMAVPAHLLEQVMSLPEGERLELADHIVATSRQAQGDEGEIADSAELQAALVRADEDVAAGRTRPAHELIADLRRALK
jgi:hypothetical protein